MGGGFTMKKIVLFLFALTILQPSLWTRGGRSFAGAAAGGIFAGLLTGAITNNSNRPSRAEQEAYHAQQQTQSLKEEIHKEKLQQLQREIVEKERVLIREMQEKERALEQKLLHGYGHSSSTLQFLLLAVVLLLFLVIGLGYIIVKKQ